MRVVTLLSDFGTADGYVAAMKGVVLSRAPDAHVVDVTHAVPAQDVRAGAWAIRHYWALYPEETIHVAVVDPGVGSKRRALIVHADGRWLIGPDNGLFSWVFTSARSCTVYQLRPSVARAGAMGSTFHGRDVFAYVAGRLAAGEPPVNLVGVAAKPFRYEWPKPKAVREGIRGEIIHIDRFGNAITNVEKSQFLRRGRLATVECNEFRVGKLSTCYADVARDEPLALCESSDLLELAVNEGNAAKTYGLRLRNPVFVRWAAKFGQKTTKKCAR